jgi:hypothetical protein
LGAGKIQVHGVNHEDVKSVETINAEQISDMTFEDALAFVNAPAVVLA